MFWIYYDGFCVIFIFAATYVAHLVINFRQRREPDATHYEQKQKPNKQLRTCVSIIGDCCLIRQQIETSELERR